MTELDPIRWTESSDDAPELLRGPFLAASREGPSAAQMRMLAVKLSAVAAGTAVAASAATAQASATASSTLAGAGTAAAGTALPFAKIVAAVAVVGATAWGGVALLHTPDTAGSRMQTKVQAPAHETPAEAPSVPELAAGRATGNTNGKVEAPVVEPLVVDEAAGAEGKSRARTHSTPSARVSQTRAAQKHAAEVRSAKTGTARTSTAAEHAPQEAHEVASVDSKVGVPSEMELLRSARSALASRPKEAFALTEQHREHYPRGVFAQERDALAIEALLRSGDTETARSLAKRFVSAHPSSPHAHRFRETLGL